MRRKRREKHEARHSEFTPSVPEAIVLKTVPFAQRLTRAITEHVRGRPIAFGDLVAQHCDIPSPQFCVRVSEIATTAFRLAGWQLAL